MRNRGFTLVELLCVIGIIAVLAAILFPVLARAKASAKRSTCISNIHQVSLANQLYSANSNESMLPMVAAKQSYDKLLEPYVLVNGVWTCPSSSSSSEDRTRSVGLNRAIGLDLRNGSLSPITNSIIEFPSDVISFVDDISLEPGTMPPLAELTPNVIHACDTALQQRMNALITNDYVKALTRHDGKGNFGMVDGSVKSLRTEQTLLPNVRWFARRQNISVFTGSDNIQNGDCSKIGLPGTPAGRDPDTKS